MDYYYADSQNNTAGPVAWAALQQLIRNGTLRPDPMVVPEGGNEWRPLSFWAAQNMDGGPASADPSSVAADGTMTAPQDTRAAFKILATNPVGGLATAFEHLGPQRGTVAGIAFAVVFVLSCALAGYRLKSAFPMHLSIGSAVYCKAFAMTIVPFVSLVAANFAARMLFRARGSLGHDCFVAGASIFPLALPILVACVVGIGETPIVFTVLVAIFAASLASLILFAGLSQIYRIPIRPASFLVPVELAVMTLAFHLVSKLLFSGGPM
jgi:hypothetical protein